MSIQADALQFFEILYGTQPPGRILISTPTGKGWPTHACTTPADAVPYVLGSVDTYHRVTLVAQKPKNGRGTANDASALTAVWLDVDVNGSPDGRGGTVTDAAASQDAALEFVQSLLVPTMLVASGYGIHAYWLLDKPFLITDEQTQAEARRLVRGWHARYKQLADEYGIPKFDPVFDLARVLRPVGSMNGKGNNPVAVELLDDGGPRYPISALLAEILDVPELATASATATVDGGSGRSVHELLSGYPKLQRLVLRQGNAPGKGSDSEWDYALSCEAMRAPRSCTDSEVRRLVAHNRQVNGDTKAKGVRNDYLDRTVSRARIDVGTDPKKGRADTTLPADIISRYWNLGADPVVSGRLIGTGLGAVVRLTRASGTLIRIDHLRILFDRAAHNREVSIATGTRFPALKGDQAHDVAQAVVAVCETTPPDPGEETADLLGEFATDIAEIVTGVMSGDTGDRWRTVKKRRDDEVRLPNHPDVPRRTVAIRDENGCLWLPAGAVRAAARFPTWADLDAHVIEAGWEIRRVDLHEPGSPRTAGNERIKGKFYVDRHAL